MRPLATGFNTPEITGRTIGASKTTAAPIATPPLISKNVHCELLGALVKLGCLHQTSRLLIYRAG